MLSRLRPLGDEIAHHASDAMHQMVTDGGAQGAAGRTGSPSECTSSYDRLALCPAGAVHRGIRVVDRRRYRFDGSSRRTRCSKAAIESCQSQRGDAAATKVPNHHPIRSVHIEHGLATAVHVAARSGRPNVLANAGRRCRRGRAAPVRTPRPPDSYRRESWMPYCSALTLLRQTSCAKGVCPGAALRFRQSSRVAALRRYVPVIGDRQSVAFSGSAPPVRDVPSPVLQGPGRYCELQRNGGGLPGRPSMVKAVPP